MRMFPAHVAEDRRVQFRMGINQGDVIVEDDDIYGDGVNVAIEGLAEGGGICVSGLVHEDVRDKLDLKINDLGEQTLKMPQLTFAFLPMPDQSFVRIDANRIHNVQMILLAKIVDVAFAPIKKLYVRTHWNGNTWIHPKYQVATLHN